MKKTRGKKGNDLFEEEPDHPAEALQESERKFREIFNKINDAIHLHEIGEGGRPGKFIDVNEVACRMLQYSREEMLEHSPLDFTTEYHSRPLEKLMEELNSAGHATFETGHRRKDGTIVPVEVNAHVITLQGKKVVLSVVRDISERKKAQEKLRYASQQLSDIIENLPDATFVIDTKGVVIAWNRAIEAMTGIKKEEMIGKGDYEYALPFYGSRRPVLIDLVFSPKEEIEKNYSGVKIEGSTIYAETFVPGTYQGKGADLWGNASPLFDAQGNLYGAIESIRDVTERKRVGEALRVSESNYRAVLENFQDVYYRSDAEGRLILASPSWATLLGYGSLDECLGFGIAEKFYAEPEKRKEFIRAVKEKGSVRDYEVVLKKKDGTPLTVATSSHLYHDGSGNVLGIEGTFRDITGYKRMEKSLRESQTRLDSILQGSPIPNFVIDKNHRIIYWNKALEKFSGVTADKVVGTNQHWRAFYEKERPTMADLLVDNAIDKIPEYYEGKFSKSRIIDGAYEATDFFPQLGKSGTWLFYTAAPILDPKGIIIGAVETLEDVTERKRAEEEIRTLSQFQESVISNANVWLMVLDDKGRILLWNNAAAEISGYSANEVINNSRIWKFLYPDRDYRKKITDTLTHIISEKKFLENFETSIQCRSGENKVILWNTRSLEMKEGQGARFVAIGVDITKSIRAEQALRESEERYRSVVEDQTEFICRFTPDGKLTFVNDAYCRYFSLDKTRCINNYHSVMLPPEDARNMRQHLAILTPDNPVGPIEHRIIMPSGEVRWQRWNDRAIFDKDGHVIEYQSVGRDMTEQKQAEEALRQSEEKFRNVLENVPDLILVHRRGVIIYVNPAMVQTMGYSPDEVLNKPLMDYIVPEYRERVAEVIRKRTDTAVIEPYEIELQSRTGEHRTVIVRGTTIEFGGSPAVLNVLTDITERKRAEEALKLSEKRYRTVLENVPDLVLVHRDGVILYINPAATDVMGFTHDELINKQMTDFIVKEDHPGVTLAISKRMDGKTIDPYEIEILTKSGGRRTVAVRGSLIEFAGSPASLNVLTDITERKRAEEALRDTEERYRSLFDRSLDCVYIHDFLGKFIDANPSALKLLGYTREEIRSVNFTSLLTAEQIPLATELIQEVITTGTQKESSEYRVRRRDGNYVDIETTATLLYHEGRPYAVQGFAHDITERKKTQERLKKFNEELELGIAERTARINASLEEKVVLLREIHHRVKNNLQIIISLLNLQSRYIKDDTTKQIIRESQNRLKAMSLVHERLYQSPDISKIDLDGYIRFLGRSLFDFYGLQRKNVTLKTDVRDVSIGINTAIPIGLIINELLSNSLKYAFPEGKSGEIFISVQKEGQVLSIVFRDNGIGLPKDLDWRKAQSLGLRIVISLVEQLQGTIELDRSAGTAFAIIVKEKE